MIQFFGLARPAQLGRRNSFHHRTASYCAIRLLLFFSPTILYGQVAQNSSSAVPAAIPAARIDLSAIGYHQPSRLDRLTEDEASVSIDFIDADHVLLTFNPKKLFQRLPGCPPDHQDRLMHAAILDLSTGKIVKEADWYLHDRRRYLWPLTPGTFLLRKLNDLYIVDSNLHQKLLLSSPRDLRWVSVTPDGGQIIVETAKDPNIAEDSKPPSSNAPAKVEPRFVAQFLDAKTLAPLRTVPLDKVVDLTGTSGGYVDLVHNGNIWLVRFGPSPTQRHNIARVRSQTIPGVFYASNNSLLIGRCASPHCDYSVSSFTTTGHRLWQQHWNHYRVFPAMARDAENSRFAVSTLRIVPLDNSAKPSTPYDPDDVSQPDLSQRDVFQQEVQIFETASGSPIASVNVSPAILSGQNCSLSPDGRRLAVLQRDSLELFDLPQKSNEELAKFLLLKADVPDLFSVASTQDSDSLPDAALDASATTSISTTPPATTSTATAGAEEDSNLTSGSDAPNRPAAQESSSISTTSTSASPPAALSQPVAEHQAALVPTFKVSTRAVVVDVVVTDSKGHPIRGLQQQDFQLWEDGKPQDLRSFRVFNDTGTEATAPPTPPSVPKPPPNVFSNDTQTADPGPVTLILFDMLNTPSQDQVFARQQLIKFLESKPKLSQFALCILSGGTTHLRLIQGFTPDETLLLAAARSNKGAPQEVRWQGSAAETRNTVSTVGVLAQGGRASGFQNLLGAVQGMQAEQLGTDTDERVAITIDSLMLLSRYLSGIPGRKNVVWLSGAFPVAITAPMGVNDAASDNRNYSQKIKGVTNILAEAQIAVYPVDVRGLLAGGFGADSTAPVAGPTRQLPNYFGAKILAPENTAAPIGLDQQDQQSSDMATLNDFASSTGGKAFLNSNGIKDAIATAAEQGSNYYTLSYTPTNKIYNGKFRKIKIQLADKKYSLHYRQGYFAEDANAPARDAALLRRTRAAAMTHASPPSRQILFSARVVPTGASKKMSHDQVGEVLIPSNKKPALPLMVNVQHYTIDYTFLGSQVHFTPLENASYRSVITLMVASFDSEGTMLTAVSHLGISNLEPSLYNNVIGGEFRLHHEVDVPVEAASLRLGIQDQMSNHLGTLEIPLPVPRPPDVPRRIKHTLPEIEPD